VLVPELAAAIRRFDTRTLIAKLHANGIPGGELRTVAEAFAPEEAKARDAIVAAPTRTLAGTHGALADADVGLADHRAGRPTHARAARARCWARCWAIQGADCRACAGRRDPVWDEAAG
jgi:crotonobetainyl-CoA:carnitine CoA-transferase CaiB-like acyl-CoA transferase